MLLENIDVAFLQDSERRIGRDIDVLIRDGEIVEVGQGLSDERSIDCRDKIALPGLINCHSHTPNILTRGWSDDESLFPWLAANEEVLQHADRDVKRAAARLSSALMVEAGTTTVNDMWNTYLRGEFEEVGIRAFLGCTLAETEETPSARVEERLESNRSFLEAYRDHPTLHPTIPLHSVYRATGELLERAHDLAAKYDVPFHVHVSETRRENEDCLAERGMSPTAWLDHLDALDRRGVLAHCVHLSDRDRERIADSGAGIAHCPAANLKLGSGIADVPAMDDIPVGLATDSAASNNTLNLFREARTAALVHKREDPGVFSAQDALDMMTLDAAAVLGVANEIGSIEPGKRADLVLLDADDPTLRPYIDDEGLLSNLIFSFHGRAETTLVEGEVVVEDGVVAADVDEAIHRIREFHADVTDDLGVTRDADDS